MYGDAVESFIERHYPAFSALLFYSTLFFLAGHGRLVSSFFFFFFMDTSSCADVSSLYHKILASLTRLFLDRR